MCPLLTQEGSQRMSDNVVKTEQNNSDQFWDELFKNLFTQLCWVVHKQFPRMPWQNIEDFVGDVVVKAHTHFSFNRLVGLSPEDRRKLLLSYCCTVAKNLVRDQWRKENHRGAINAAPAHHVSKVPVSESPPLELRLTPERIRACLQKLSPLEQELLERKLVDGWTYSEISHQFRVDYGMGFTIGQLKMMKLRAVEQIKQDLL